MVNLHLQEKLKDENNNLQEMVESLKSKLANTVPKEDFEAVNILRAEEAAKMVNVNVTYFCRYYSAFCSKSKLLTVFGIINPPGVKIGNTTKERTKNNIICRQIYSKI